MKNIDVRIIVDESGLTYIDIAKQMGISRVWLSNLMRHDLTMENREKILKAIKELEKKKKEKETHDTKRIYISGPITGDPDYLRKFKQAETELIYQGYTSIVNPAKVNRLLPEDFTHQEYMDVSIAQLRCCDAIYLLRGWEQSRGAKIEKEIAESEGKEIVYQS